MTLYLNNDALMYCMFPSSLGLVSLRWFNRLEHSSIHSWDEMAEAFVSLFITNSQKPRELDFPSINEHERLGILEGLFLQILRGI